LTAYEWAGWDLISVVSSLAWIGVTSAHYKLLEGVRFSQGDHRTFLNRCSGNQGMSCGTIFCHHDDPAEKEVTMSRHRFPKPIDEYAILLFFGSNIVASEDEDWKRVRKIVAPAFSDVRHLSYVIYVVSLTFAAQRNNRLVWDETQLIMLDLFNNVWGDRKEIVVDHCVDITLQVYLCLSSTFQVTLSDFQDCAIRYQCCRYRCHT
jgi:hypothetical protein